MEISFLELLLRYKNEIVHYNNIENELYSEKGFNKEALRMLTSRIRKKIGIPMILSHSDLGYSIKIDFH
jgi:DNA-binding response OmpR family regulator